MIDIRQETKIVTKPAPAAPAPRRPVEDWLGRKKVPAPLAAALWRYTRWGRGRLVTEEQFDAVLADLSTKPASEV